MHQSTMMKRSQPAVSAQRGCRGRFTALGVAALCVIASLATGRDVVQWRKFVPADNASTNFGHSVAIDGSIAIVGAPTDDDNGDNSGAAYLIDVATCEPLAKFLADGGAAGDRFGNAVAIADSIAIVGASMANGGNGEAYLFDVARGTQIARLLPDCGGPIHFGCSVAIDGSIAIVGAYHDNESAFEAGAVYVFDVTTGERLAKLLADDGFAYDSLGYSVAIDGSIVIAGAPGDSDYGPDSGSAYLFDVTTGEQLAKFVPDDGAMHDGFGYSVAIDGSIAIIGAPTDDDLGTSSGSAYLYDVSAGELIAKIVADHGAALDRFGCAVAIDGSIAIIGAWGDQDYGSDAGAAYLFESATGAPLAELRPDDGAADDEFGRAVAIDGSTAIVGTPYDDSGSAYLFDAATGEEIDKLLPGGGTRDDCFGYAVDIDDFTAIVGAVNDRDSGWGSASLFEVADGHEIARLLPADYAPQFGSAVAIDGPIAIVGALADDDNGDESGSAFLFDATTGEQIGKLLPDDGAAFDHFGHSVNIDGSIAIVGAPGTRDNGLDSGSAYLLNVDTGALIAKLLPDDGAAEDHFGFSVAIGAGLALLGAPGDSDHGSDSGSVYVFDAATGHQLHKFLPNDGEANDYFGFSVAIFGSLALIGTPGDDDKGDASGSAYVFNLSTGEQIAKLMPDDGEAGDCFGLSLSLDGSIAVIGAPRNDDNGDRSGSTYFFDLDDMQQFDKFVPTDTTASDEFGYAVAISGWYAILGAPHQDSADAADSGAAYLTWLRPTVPGDLNGDGCVNQRDLGILLTSFGIDGGGDLDGDGDTDSSDLGILLANYEQQGC